MLNISALHMAGFYSDEEKPENYGRVSNSLKRSSARGDALLQDIGKYKMTDHEK